MGWAVILFRARTLRLPLVVIVGLGPFLLADLLIFKIVLIVGWHYGLTVVIPTCNGECFVVGLGRLRDDPSIGLGKSCCHGVGETFLCELWAFNEALQLGVSGK